MTKKRQVLIIYSTTDGQCLKVSNYIKKFIDADVNVISIHDNIPDIKQYDGIIIGASIRYGKHNKKIKKFINTHYKEIEAIPNAFFSISLVARKPERQTIETNPYIQKFLDQIQWKPQILSIIGGVLNYPSYSFLDKYMIKLIMHITKGPTDLKTNIEYTDWNQVENFAKNFNKQLTLI